MKNDVRLSDDESDSETENADETDKNASLEQVCSHSRWPPSQLRYVCDYVWAKTSRSCAFGDL